MAKYNITKVKSYTRLGKGNRVIRVKSYKKKKRIVMRPDSIWANIDFKIKKKQKFGKKDLDVVEYYVEHGGDILDTFGDWVDVQQNLMEQHREKLNKVKALKLAQVI